MRQPCFSCRDFKAVAIHEVGHLLSLDHISNPVNAIPLAVLALDALPPPPPMHLTRQTNYTMSEVPPYHTLRPSVNCRDPLSSVRTSEPWEYTAINVSGSASVMVAFGSTGLERPSAGKLRRCLDQSDLDGVNFLYASCGTPLVAPGCAYDRGTAAGLKLSEEWFKLFLLPTIFLVALKVVAHSLLIVEDVVATWQALHLSTPVPQPSPCRLFTAVSVSGQDRGPKAAARGLDRKRTPHGATVLVGVR